LILVHISRCRPISAFASPEYIVKFYRLAFAV